MKKSFKTTMLAIALIASVTGAFATKARTAPAQAPRYNWAGLGPNGSGMFLNRTVAEAVSFYGCTAGSNICAIGTSVTGGGPVILEKP